MAQKVNKDFWIPCKKRQPKSDDFYMVTMTGETWGDESGKRHVTICLFENGKWVEPEANDDGSDMDITDLVKAWADPEPYMG